MARPEHLAALGNQIDKLREESRASLLTSIFLMVRYTLFLEGEEKALIDFTKFYEEMLFGMDPEAMEAGARQWTLNDLKKKIQGLPFSEELKKVCLTLATHMEPPLPLPR